MSSHDGMRRVLREHQKETTGNVSEGTPEREFLTWDEKPLGLVLISQNM